MYKYIYIYRYPISHIFWQPHIILLLFHQFFASRLMCIRYLSSLCWMPPAISNESMKGYSEVPRSRRTETWTFRSGEFRWRIGQTLKPCWKPQFWPSRTEIGNMVPSTDSGFCQGPTPDRCWLEIVITKLILALFLWNWFGPHNKIKPQTNLQGPPESRWLPRAAVHGGWPKQHRHPPHSCHRRYDPVSGVLQQRLLQTNELSPTKLGLFLSKNCGSLQTWQSTIDDQTTIKP